MKYLLSYIIICACMFNPDVGYAQTVIQDHNGKISVIQLGQPNGSFIIGNDVIISNQYQNRSYTYIPPPTKNNYNYKPYQWRCDLSNGCISRNRKGDSWDD